MNKTKTYDYETLKNMTYNYIIDYEIATVNEIELVTLIKGNDLSTLNDIIYVRTDYHDLEQLTANEDKEYYNKYFLKDNI